MSEGPIKQWRDSWKPPQVSTKDAQRVCRSQTFALAYCGRKLKPGNSTRDWDAVTCSDCLAAQRADA